MLSLLPLSHYGGGRERRGSPPKKNMNKKEIIEKLVDAIYDYHAGGPTSDEVLNRVGIPADHPRRKDMCQEIAFANRDIEESWARWDAENPGAEAGGEDSADDVVIARAENIVEMI